MGLRLTLAVHLSVYHTSQYTNNLFFYAVYGFINSYVLNSNPRLHILQQEGHVANNNKP